METFTSVVVDSAPNARAAPAPARPGEAARSGDGRVNGAARAHPAPALLHRTPPPVPAAPSVERGYLSPAQLYGEDLDYGRRNPGGIARFTRAITTIGELLGMEVSTQAGVFPKIALPAPFESGSGTMRV